MHAAKPHLTKDKREELKDKFKEIFAPIQVQKMEEIPLEQNMPEEPEEKKP